jgi:hypothetical protein
VGSRKDEAMETTLILIVWLMMIPSLLLLAHTTGLWDFREEKVWSTAMVCVIVAVWPLWLWAFALAIVVFSLSAWGDYMCENRQCYVIGAELHHNTHTPPQYPASPVEPWV